MAKSESKLSLAEAIQTADLAMRAINGPSARGQIESAKAILTKSLNVIVEHIGAEVGKEVA